jgi:hypothetical protein
MLGFLKDRGIKNKVPGELIISNGMPNRYAIRLD